MTGYAQLVVGQARLRYLDVGAGPALVLLHGHPFDLTMWEPQVPEFQRWSRVIALDLRGYGESRGGVTSKTSMTRFADDVQALLDHLDIDDASLCGLSMAGQIVMQCLAQFPDRIRTVVLADTTARAETPEGRQARYTQADRLEREGMSPYANEVLPKMIHPSNIAALPGVANAVLDMMRRTDPLAAAAALRGRAERQDYLPVLRACAVPALMVAGSEDAFTPAGDAQEMAEAAPDATLEVVAGAAHLPNLERPAQFNALVNRFLAAARTDVKTDKPC